MKRIVITGAGSYIGMSVEKWLNRPDFAGMYQVDTIDMRDEGWRKRDFSAYESVFHVAGIAHVDAGRITQHQKREYYHVNCELALETAEKAKSEGVRQFIYMSSIIIYGEQRSLREKRIITRETKPSPSNAYGDSKWKAEQGLMSLADEYFHVAILRPPMVYGRGCKGNYRFLEKIAVCSPVFPDFPNERSILRIDRLCEFVRRLTEEGSGGVFFPQNEEYAKTADLVKQIAEKKGKDIHLLKEMNWMIYMLGVVPGKAGATIRKAFGSLIYEKGM